MLNSRPAQPLPPHRKRVRYSLRRQGASHRRMALCLIGGYLPKPPNPRWSVYVPYASRTASPLPTLTSCPKTSAFQADKTAFYKSARCTIVIQLNVAAMPKKTLLAFSKINDCPTIESCPIAPKSPGTAERPLQPAGAKASLPRAERHRGSFCGHKNTNLLLFGWWPDLHITV